MNVLYVVVFGVGKCWFNWSLETGQCSCSECFWLVPGTEDEL